MPGLDIPSRRGIPRDLSHPRVYKQAGTSGFLIAVLNGKKYRNVQAGAALPHRACIQDMSACNSLRRLQYVSVLPTIARHVGKASWDISLPLSKEL